MWRHLGVLLTLLSGLIQFTKCQVPFLNTCPAVKVMETFDVDRYMGTWYEYSKYPFAFEMGQKCQKAVYKNEGNNTISVVNTGVYMLVNISSSTIGTAKVLAPGQLAVAFKKQTTDTANYLVLGTDYVNWAVVYNCKNITSYGHVKLLWILTRQRQPSEEAVTAATQVMKDNNLSEQFLLRSGQKDCPKILEATSVNDQEAEASSSSAVIGDQSTVEFSTTTTEQLMETA